MKTLSQKWLNLLPYSITLIFLTSQGCSRDNQDHASKWSGDNKMPSSSVSLNNASSVKYSPLLGGKLQTNQIEVLQSNGPSVYNTNEMSKTNDLETSDDEMLNVVRHYLSRNGQQPPNDIVIVVRSSALWKFRYNINLPTEMEMWVDFKTKRVIKVLGE